MIRMKLQGIIRSRVEIIGFRSGLGFGVFGMVLAGHYASQ